MSGPCSADWLITAGASFPTLGTFQSRLMLHTPYLSVVSENHVCRLRALHGTSFSLDIQETRALAHCQVVEFFLLLSLELDLCEVVPVAIVTSQLPCGFCEGVVVWLCLFKVVLWSSHSLHCPYAVDPPVVAACALSSKSAILPGHAPSLQNMGLAKHGS